MNVYALTKSRVLHVLADDGDGLPAVASCGFTATYENATRLWGSPLTGYRLCQRCTQAHPVIDLDGGGVLIPCVLIDSPRHAADVLGYQPHRVTGPHSYRRDTLERVNERDAWQYETMRAFHVH